MGISPDLVTPNNGHSYLADPQGMFQNPASPIVFKEEKPKSINTSRTFCFIFCTDATGNNWQQDHHPQYPSAPPISSFSYMPLTPPPTTTHNVTVVTAAAPQIMGGCPACRIGTMEKGFTCCGICCAICLFPIGILCCFCMRRMKCRNCGATL